MEIEAKEYSSNNQTKSRERVRDLAEVFTADKEVNAMLDLLGETAYSIETRNLEPSCGNGNFLVAILERKLNTVASKFKQQMDFEYQTLIALASIYGVDIDSENIKEAKSRMKDVIVDRYSDVLNTRKPTDGFYSAVDYILKTNVIKGDMVKGQQKIKFTEYSSPKIYKFTQRVFNLVDLTEATGSLWADAPDPILEIPMKNYWELSKDV